MLLKLVNDVYLRVVFVSLCVILYYFFFTDVGHPVDDPNPRNVERRSRRQKGGGKGRCQEIRPFCGSDICGVER